MKILLDSNVLLYVMDKNSKYHNISVSILENSKYELFVSTKNISEIIAVSSKIKIDKSKVLNFIKKVVLEVSSLIYPNSQSFDKFLQIIEKYNIKGNETYDMEIASIMLTNNINTIATFNHKDFAEIDEIEILEDCL
ncbi:MAG: type II toxin-antitoxin system VapC family toxin [Bacteroidota bacterium]|nr:type II toxin-antitoxin system VapC family toxin [Bacteroidota bacterium]